MAGINISEITKDLLETLTKFRKVSITKDNVDELEAAFGAALNKLPDDGKSVQEFLTAHKDLGTNVLEGVQTKTALVKKVAEVFSNFRLHQERLKLLTDDPKNPNAGKLYFKKLYYHELLRKDDPVKQAEFDSKFTVAKEAKKQIDNKMAENATLNLDRIADINKNISLTLYEVKKKFENPNSTILDPFSFIQNKEEKEEDKKLSAGGLDLLKKKKEEKLLAALLRKMDKENRHPHILARILGWFKPIKLTAGKTYTVTLGKEKHKVRLTNDILIQYERIWNPSKFRFEKEPRFRIFSNQVLGKGKHGTIYASAGTIKIKKNKDGSDFLKVSSKSSHIIKKLSQNRLVMDTPATIKREVSFLTQVEPKAKASTSRVTSPFSSDSFIVDARFNGAKLADIIEEQAKSGDKPAFDIEWLSDVTRNLFYYLQHIHFLGFIHHDIWPDNIMINKATRESRIIDLGCAKKTDEFLQWGGNHKYRPPEKNLIPIFFTHLSVKPLVDQTSDIFMLGKSLKELWGANKQIDRDPRAKEIIELLEKCTNANREERPTIIDMLTALETFRSDSKSDKTIPQEAKDIISKALEARNKLLEAKHSKSTTLSSFKKDICKIINDIPDYRDDQTQEAVIKQFVRTVNVRAFIGLEKKEELTEKVNTIVDDFKYNLIALSSIQRQVLALLKIVKKYPQKGDMQDFRNEIERFLSEVNHRVHKARKCPTTLDAMHAFNEKMRAEKLLETLQSGLDYLTDERPYTDDTPKEILQQRNIIAQLKPTRDIAKDEKKSRLQLQVFDALRTYLAEDASQKPSDRRLGHIQEILNALKESYGDTDDFENKAKGILGESGFFKRSRLRDRVETAIAKSKPPSP